MQLSPIDLILALLSVTLLYNLNVRLARTVPNSNMDRLLQTTAGKLVVFITVLLLLCTAAYLYIVFVVGY